MGNHRFKLSDMVPNAWFYMLKDMRKSIKGKPKGQHQKSFQIKPQNEEAVLPSRASYFFSNREEAEKPHLSPPHPRASDTLFPQESPTNSKKRSRRKPNSYKLTSSYSEFSNLQLQLPPITTKPDKKEAATRRSPAGIHRLRLRATSPRVGRKSISKQEEEKKKKGISKSFAVVKSSTNPEKDFRESMLEMIGENNIRSSKGLEELLACYLLLNANEYHDVIVKVFERIWFDLTDMMSL